MPALSSREAEILAALSTSFDRTWMIAQRAGLSGPKATETAASFLTALAGRGLVEKGGSRNDATWRRVRSALESTA